MLTIGSSLLSTLLSLAAAFLALSVAVQILQELWKYLTSSKSRAYRIALEDFLGPWTNGLLRQNGQSALRGPFQVLRFKPGKTFLPMTRQQIGAGLEGMAPAWVARTLETIDTELSLQGSAAAPPSALWKMFCHDLASGDPGAADVRVFLEEWGHRFGKSGGAISARKLPATLDARQLRIAFRQRFFADVDAALERFEAFEQNFEFAYKRRNLRQTFTIALLVAFFFNLPFDVLYQKASAITPEEAAIVAEKAIALYDRAPKDSLGRADMSAIALVTDATRIAGQTFQPAGVDYLVSLNDLRKIHEEGALIRHILGLLITALLTSFGAPVWNDLTNLLLRAGRSLRRPADEQA